MERKFGLSSIRSDQDLAAIVESRLPASAVRSLVRSGLSYAEAYSLIVPSRTLAHRLAKQEPLSREESDKAVRVARITSLAEQTFGKRQFRKRTPIKLLATEAGARLIEEMLYQIHDGIA